jgi:hypothetical protein
MKRLEKREDADIVDAENRPWGSSRELLGLSSVRSSESGGVDGMMVGVSVLAAPECTESCVGSPGGDSGVTVLESSTAMLLVSSASESALALNNYEPIGTHLSSSVHVVVQLQPT